MFIFSLTADGPPSDERLVERVARERDAKALETLYERHSRLIYSLLVRIVGEPSLAEDVLQEAFLRIWRHAHSFDADRGRAVPWLIRMSRNLAIDYLRGKSEKQRQREAPAIDPSEPASLPVIEAQLDQRLQAERVRALIDGLPVPQRRALELAYFHGLSHSEIAQTMDEPLGTVKTWLRSALGKLRAELGVSQ